MDLIKAANEWAKAEIVSSMFFMFFGLSYILISIACWKVGNTPLTEALYIPLLIAGGLLLSAGISFYFSNKSKLNNFETEYRANAAALIKAEKSKTESTIKTYQNVALKVFPAIVILAILISLLISNPTVKAICIAIVAFLSVLVILDSQALKRIKTYYQKLQLADESLRKTDANNS